MCIGKLYGNQLAILMGFCKSNEVGNASGLALSASRSVRKFKIYEHEHHVMLAKWSVF
jgi:hypothetical protein